MEPLQFGPVTLGGIPRIIAVFNCVTTPEKAARVYADGATIAEIRFDLLGVPVAEALEFAKTLRGAAPFGLLGTLRETRENKKKRLALFRELIPVVDAVDIEIDTPIRQDVIALCAGKCVVVSHHDFDKMPDKKELMRIGETARKAGANIVKIAGMAHSPEDAARLLAFAKGAPYPVIAIAMGDAGMDARIEALRHGSLATYAYAGSSPVAPGQRSVAEIAERLSKDFPAFHK